MAFISSHVVDINERAAILIQKGDYYNAHKRLEKSQKLLESLRAIWLPNKTLVGDIYSNYEACKAMISTYNNLGVLYKQ